MNLKGAQQMAPIHLTFHCIDTNQWVGQQVVWMLIKSKESEKGYKIDIPLRNT